MKKSVSKTRVKKDKSNKNFLINFKELMFNSNKFVDFVSGRQGYQKVMRDFVFIYIAYFIFSVIIGLAFQTPDFKEILSGFVFAVIAAVIIPFVISALIHLGVIAFRGKGNYFDTFKAITYSLGIIVIYSFLISIVQLIIYLIMPYDTTLLNQISSATDPQLIASLYQAFIAQSGVKISLIFYCILTLISIIHGFVFGLKSIKKLHDMKTGKAVGAILIPLVVIIALLGVLVFFSVVSQTSG